MVTHLLHLVVVICLLHLQDQECVCLLLQDQECVCHLLQVEYLPLLLRILLCPLLRLEIEVLFLVLFVVEPDLKKFLIPKREDLKNLPEKYKENRKREDLERVLLLKVLRLGALLLLELDHHLLPEVFLLELESHPNKLAVCLLVVCLLQIVLAVCLLVVCLPQIVLAVCHLLVLIVLVVCLLQIELVVLLLIVLVVCLLLQQVVVCLLLLLQQVVLVVCRLLLLEVEMLFLVLSVVELDLKKFQNQKRKDLKNLLVEWLIN